MCIEYLLRTHKISPYGRDDKNYASLIQDEASLESLLSEVGLYVLTLPVVLVVLGDSLQHGDHVGMGIVQSFRSRLVLGSQRAFLAAAFPMRADGNPPFIIGSNLESTPHLLQLRAFE
uniref:Uncharacterized protein n=1 Tax=Candidatus Kentrum sp. LPFa TaxID=2126335 RepID=A0A450VX17_9GAMM|nr:MAG: hypothetical protein BECKLPF1236B_GA0070989_100810 [Candidatus Kentron sp. LPFa]